METIKLQFPVEHNGGEIASLKMRRPRVRDQRVADKSADDVGDKEIALFANLCEVDPEVIHDLDLADYTNVQEAYKGFLSSTKAPSSEPA